MYCAVFPCITPFYYFIVLEEIHRNHLEQYNKDKTRMILVNFLISQPKKRK